ncbi:MAG: IS1182 family transposase [Actinobacteria bacterium]|nr:IS1182 family transposase [Actinomycetota bacterium]MBM3713827.1 IS1182 family transposase [Actinomycetota bacterium]
MPVPFKKDPVEFNQRKLLAEDVFDLLQKDHDCFIYEDILSAIDTKSIEKKFSMIGQHAYHPRLITAILIYAYSQGIFSSRKIEQKCSQDLSFMYISHANCPNFRVLSDFRKDNWGFFVECFKASVKIASGLGMVSLGHVGIDGSKFHANTSKHKAASYSHLNANEDKLKHEIEELLRKAEDTDSAEDKIYHNGNGYSIPDELKIKQKRLEKIKKIKKELEEREQRENPGKNIDSKKQISYADTDAKMMKSRGNFEYCYNGQISVDSQNQIIVSQHLTQNANDKNELKKEVDDIKKNTGKTPEKITADSGYRSSDNILTLEESKIDGYIATGKGEKDISQDTNKKIGKSQFLYDSQKDIFICPAGALLKLKSIGENRVYKAEEMVCGGCSLKNICSASKGSTATIYTDESGIILAVMAEKMKKDSSKEIYAKRKIIVEPVFGQIKTGGFRRFNLRGFKKAGGEFSLVCAVSNFKKIVNMIKDKTRCSKERELLLQAI